MGAGLLTKPEREVQTQPTIDDNTRMLATRNIANNTTSEYCNVDIPPLIKPLGGLGATT